MEKFIKYQSYQLASTLSVIHSQNETGATQILGDEMEAELERRRSEIGSNTFISDLIDRTAEVSVTSSALRNQGAGGIINSCREYFKAIDLLDFASYLNSLNYKSYLDKETETLLDNFPAEGKSWGAARKGLNLFFRDICYNYYLREYLALQPDEKDSSLSRLEIPLDRDVALSLRKIHPDLPKWNSIKSLTSEENDSYQRKAKDYADSTETLRVHLDLIFWRRF